ncbi:ATPase [Treponema sp. OMZ 840]|uniref:V-type ATP synthase subunit I n=1 Tax=Treponema sp. OMZ 840 TaxID=244313 RepID=UPI003D8C8C04
MIVPMKKISLVVLDAERKKALQKLRKLGLVHIEEVEGRGETFNEYKNNFEKLQNAYALVSEIKRKDLKNAQKPLSFEEASAKAAEITAWNAEIKDMEEKIHSAKAELERLERWGGVDTDDLAFLQGKNIVLSLYEIATDKYSSLSENIKTIFVNRDKNITRFLLIEKDGDEAQSASDKAALPPEAYAVPLPHVSTKKLAEEIENLSAEKKQKAEKIASAAVYTEALKNAVDTAEKALEFENLNSGMERDEEGSHALAWLTGYIPASDLAKLQAAAQKEQWALVAADPAEEDAVPTKLKNNKLVSLIYPLSDFLDVVPGYREYDISGWFLLFFAVFFGMIFGDAGYGSLMVVLSLVITFIGFAKGKKPKSEAGLLFILGAATLVWGTLTCSWFGIPHEKLPPALVSLAFEPFSSAYAAQSEANNRWVVQNLQIFCFCLALFHLSIAHIKSIVRNIRSLKAVGDLGALFMLWGMFYVVLNMVVDNQRFPFDAPVPIASLSGYPILYPVALLVGGGFALSFVFSSYEGSIKESILSSLKNLISVLLGVVNVFSDIVSYIRLWAVGLAGAAISSTVNTMAGPMLGGFIIFAGILLLVFGHGLNLILNMLSVIVHGVRLNTLEFSNHLGMVWAGFKYKPFKE